MKKVLFLLLTIFALSAHISISAQENKDSLKLVYLQEVQIVSSRATEKTPLTYSDLDKKEIERLNFGLDIPFLLTLTPSVVATSDAGTGVGYTNFRIRGTDANRINITSNGVPMNDAESQSVFWVNIPDFASSVQDLQVQRGVGTSANGAGAFGASVNLKTESIPSVPYGELNGGYGSFNTSKATLKLGTGQIASHWAFDARLSGINSDGYIDRASVELKSYFFQGGYFNENTLLKFITFGGKEKTYHAWDGVPGEILPDDRTYNPSGYMGDDMDGNPLYYDNQTDNYIQTNYQLSLMQVLNPSFKLNVTLHYTKGDGYYEEYKTGRKLAEYGLSPFVYDGTTITKSDLVRKKHLDNGFGGIIYSLDYKNEKWDASLGGGANYYDGDHFGRVIWVKNYAGDIGFFPEHEYYKNKAEKTDVNVYLKGNYQLNSQWNAYVDVQYRFLDYKINGKNDDWDSETGDMQLLDFNNQFNFFNPKAGLFYRINMQNDVYISFATGHREPNRKNYTDQKLVEMPKAETLYDYEFGYKLRNTLFSAGLNLYYMQYKDQLILTGETNDIGEMLTSNVPDSYRMGAEFTLGAVILPCLTWSGNLTLSENKINNYTEYVTNWTTGEQISNYLGKTTISYSPDMIANSLFSFFYKEWSAGLQSSYVGKQYLDNTVNEDRKLDPYFINNLRIAYTFKLKGIKALGISLLINNILNEKYENNGYVYDTYYQGTGNNPDRVNEIRYFPQAGTNILTNISVKF